MKRLLAFFLAICLCLSGVITAAPQASAEMTLGDSGQENSWRYSDGELLPADELESGVMPMAAYPSQATATGIDVSVHQGKIDWTSVKADGIAFAIIRCGYGQDSTSQDDTYFAYNVAECERLGIPFGLYFYSYATSTSRASGEADHAIRLINTCKNYSMFKLPMYYDLEDSSVLATGKATILSMSKTFHDKVESATGIPVGIYANTNWFTNYLTDSWYQSQPLWCAQYSSSCTYNGNYQIWQYTSSGSVSGISGRVDKNYLLVDPGTYGIGGSASTSGYTASLSTNKETYSSREAIMITANTDAPDSWVALYRSTDGAPASNNPSIWWYTLKDSNGSNVHNNVAFNLLDGEMTTGDADAEYCLEVDRHGTFAGALRPGTYTLYVLENSSSYNVLAQKTITVTGDYWGNHSTVSGTESYVTTDKTVYPAGTTHVYVTAYNLGYDAWVGIYPADETTYSKYFCYYYTYNQSGNVIDVLWDYDDNSWDVANGASRSWPLANGTYKAVLFSDGYNKVAETTFTIGTPTLTTNKTSYCAGEAVKVTTNYQAEGAWVGLYKNGVTPGSANPSIYWYYIDEAGNSEVNILEQTGGDTGSYGAGTYKIILFADNGYSQLTSTTITVNACADTNPRDHKCDTCGATLSSCADGNNDHKCDVCGKTLSSCADGNNDHKCDICGKTLTECADGNNDHKCDKCGKTLTECADGNNDHKCDVCGKTLSSCTDTNPADHKCDVCGKTLSSCADGNNDHKCDKCGKTLTECADGNNDHKCDKCGKTLSSCADGNNDHKCDVCGKTLSSCTDTDPADHYCDVCGDKLTSCTDTNPADHKCDVCGKTLSECSDAEGDGDHDCDICGEEDITDCSDSSTDKDHNCDECGKTGMNACVDTNPADHKCDVCGATLSECSDPSGDGDHDCDHCGKEDVTDCSDGNGDNKCDECGATICEHVDTNPADHKCDKCGKTLSECSDAEGDGDHDCDICGEEDITDCADSTTDKDHNCDECGKTGMNACVDTNPADHKCDVCGKTLSECSDAEGDGDHDCDICGEEDITDCSDSTTDKDHNCDECGKEDMNACVDTDPADHKCDVCGETLSECADAEGDDDHDCDHCGKEDATDCADGNGDNKCDECGSTICEHVDANPADHKCDKCGRVLSECADENKDHKCDLCDKVLSECEDENKDHKCDLCDKVLSECEDENKDHKCDLCDKVLTDCVDEDKDYKCDICGKDLEKPEQPVEKDEVIRLAGANRWETALKVADEMKANLGLEKFDAIIIASGNDFADALAGSYLSTVKNAPILLGWGNGGKYEYLDTDNIEYIKANLAENGVIYILGGEKAVPKLYEDALKGYNVERLGGANRFETNLLILEEAGVNEGDEILVCTATNFADSLSASATAKPILLVFNEYGKLYGKQPEFLSGLKNCTFTVIGGESAVSAKLAAALMPYGATTRLAGANRFETSVMVAQKYFDEPTTAVLAYAWNYPDGLCGGSLAYSLKAPLILTMTKYEAKAVAYAKEAGIEIGLVLGGDTLISDDAVRAIFAMEADEVIIEK